MESVMFGAIAARPAEKPERSEDSCAKSRGLVSVAALAGMRVPLPLL